MRALVPAGRWRPAAPDAPPGPTLPDMWRANWASHPTAPVLLDGPSATSPGEATVVSAAGLDAHTARLARALTERGVGPGTRVLWCDRSSVPSVEALVAVLRTGSVLVTVSPASTPAELAHVTEDCAPILALSNHVDAAVFPSGLTVLSSDELLTSSALGTAEPSSTTWPPLDPAADALIVYTSGTTGKPKGAVHTHASLRAGVTAVVDGWGWRRQDRLILALPLFHVHGLCAGLFGTLTAGASAMVFDRFDEDSVLSAAVSGQASMFFGVPTMYHRLAATGRAGALANLRVCVCGSAPLAAALWSELSGQGVDVLERYGMTETLLTLSNPLDGERRPGAVGQPLPGLEAVIDQVDGDGVGELLVRGPSLCRGYWGRADDLLDDEGWFATGDLASVSDDGFVSIRGRRTELIITGGHNVYPAEVEAVLARHPDVAEVAVVGVPSDEWGETVVAFVVGSPDPAELDRLAEAELAPFKRPREVRLVAALPRNALGKVVRKDLR